MIDIHDHGLQPTWLKTKHTRNSSLNEYHEDWLILIFSHLFYKQHIPSLDVTPLLDKISSLFDSQAFDSILNIATSS